MSTIIALQIQDERSVEASTDGHETPEVAISSLVGNKCLAPFKDITGQKSFHNAIIFSGEYSCIFLNRLAQL